MTLPPSLIGYIPTLNQRHLEWFKKYPKSSLFLISQENAQKILPRLARDLSAVPAELLARAINGLGLMRDASVFAPHFGSEVDPRTPAWKNWILPDEDISHLLAEKYLVPAGCNVKYEMIWARWDMSAVISEQPVLPDMDISLEEFDREVLRDAGKLAQHSPDWWRQVGAVAFAMEGNRLAAAFNTHMPNEYETYIFGDPSTNRDAGKKGKSCALHAEAAVIAECARSGLRLCCGKIYVTTFPCEGCAAMIAATEISTVYFSEGYSSLNAQDIFRARGIKMVQVK